MTTFNNQGFVLKREDGRLIADSHVSAHSKRVARTNSVLEPVPDVPELYVRLGKLEATKLSDGERAALHARAREWYVAQFGEPEAVEPAEAAVTNVTAEAGDEGEPSTPDDAEPEEWSLNDLRSRASELDIPGRSKMGREELIAAIQDAERDA